MKKMILASTSTIHGEEYLEYLLEEVKKLFVQMQKYPIYTICKTIWNYTFAIYKKGSRSI